MIQTAGREGREGRCGVTAKLCPFCGYNQIDKADVIEDESGIAGVTGEMYVCCPSCCAFGPKPEKRTRTEAMRAWNRRAKAAKAGKACSQCGRLVEKERECYAVPTCYVCLPPPEPLPVRKAAKDGKEGSNG